jgi:hypothetical protein
MAIDFTKTADATVDQEPQAAEEFVTRKLPATGAALIHEMERNPEKFILIRKDDFERGKVISAKMLVELSKIQASAQGFEIKTEDDANWMLNTGAAAKKLFKRFEDLRKSLIGEPDFYVRGVNTFFRKPKSMTEAIEKVVKSKIGQYNYQKEIKRRENEKKMREEAARQQAAIDKQAKEAGVESITLPLIVTPKKIETIRSDSASGSTRFKKVPKVVNFAILDDKYKVVNGTALQAAVDAGLKPDGVEIEEKPMVSIRMS